ncbi:MAG: cell division/cell wall cluster transcriptional repressor MraZ [Bacteroidaceae bacterium]|nr:cell division/cell wall cluster transcriptional repressor MraZ [Bacteroidaceae bacterium]
MNFIGQYPVKLDAKNRAFMPAGFRRQMIEASRQELGAEGTVKELDQLSLVVRKDYFEDCLVIYTKQAWEEEVGKVRARLNRFDGNQQMLYRKMVSDAQLLQLDPSGRILFPKILLDRVGIDRDIIFVGMQQTIEVWAQEKAAGGQDEAFMSDADFASGIQKCMSD